MTHLSLFSGIGGLDIAAEMAGFETVGQCEAADYPTKILEQHWPEVPRWRDIRALTKGGFYERTGLQTVDLISGGFPCQPFSTAGKRLGRSDPRYLWPEMFRVITEFTPRWIVAENVPGILRIAAADVIADLESAGYHAVVFVYEAAAVGAPHRRSRVAFVANRAAALGDAKHDGSLAAAVARSADPAGDHNTQGADASRESAGANLPGNRGALADPDFARLQRRERGSVPECSGERAAGTRCASKPLVDDPDRIRCCRDARRRQFAQLADGRWWAVEPDVGRVAHGVSNRVHRIKALGNAVVPMQFYPIFKAIWEVEHENRLT